MRYGLLAGGVFLVILLWCGAWFYLKGALEGQIQRQLALLSQRGQEVSCPQLSVDGFPFRYEVSCRQPAFQGPEGRLFHFKGLRTVALIYKPWHIIAEALGPARYEDLQSGLVVDADWRGARSSAILSTSALDQLDMSLEMPVIAAGLPTGRLSATATRGELHTRPLPGAPRTLEAFLSLQDMRLRDIGADNETFDLKLHLQLPEGMALMEGGKIHDLMTGPEGDIPVKVVWASLKNAGSEVDLTGGLTLDQDGLLSGNAVLTLSGHQDLSRKIVSTFPEAEDSLRLIEGAAMSFGERVEDEAGSQRIRLPLSIKKGTISVGIVPLWVLPPLF